MASEEKIMSTPKMPPEYELPSLCGANPQFNDVQKKMDDAINELMRFCTVLSFSSDERMSLIDSLQQTKDTIRASSFKLFKLFLISLK